MQCMALKSGVKKKFLHLDSVTKEVSATHSHTHTHYQPHSIGSVLASCSQETHFAGPTILTILFGFWQGRRRKTERPACKSQINYQTL